VSTEELAPDESAAVSRRRSETFFAMLRRFGRLWGFLAFLLFVIVLFRQVVLPFVFAVVVAYLLAPIIRRLQPNIGRAPAVIAVYLVIVTVLVVFFGLLMPAVLQDIARFRDAAPQLIAQLEREWLPRASEWVEGISGGLLHPNNPEVPPGTEAMLTPLENGSWRVDLAGVRLSVEETREGVWIIHAPQPADEDLADVVKRLVASKGGQLTGVLGDWIQAFIAGVVSFLTKLIITFMLAAFILIDLDRVNRFVRSLVPTEYRPNFDELVSGVDVGLAGVVRGQLLICLVNGVLTYIGLVVFGIKYSFLLAVVAGVFSLVPIFGTILSSIPILLLAVVSSESGVDLGPAIGMLAWIAGIHLLEANVLNPKIIGDSAHIHPVVVVFALLAGEHVYGLTGALLAVPVASMVQTVFLYARKRSPVFAGDTELRSPSDLKV